MSERITIILGKGARTSTLETEGFKGGACLVASEIFKKHLGEVQHLEDKQEMFESAHCEQQAQQG